MKVAKVAHHRHELSFPAKEPPSWSAKVERWYQLDAYAYLLPEAFARWELSSRPSSMLLACGGASNLTDHAFATSGAQSPTKFVHTLPNIRASSLLAVMGWEGTVFSLHRDPCTLAVSFSEAIRRASAGEECWVWSVRPPASNRWVVDLFTFGSAKHTHQLFPQARTSAWPEDMEILRWFWDSEGSLEIGNWVVRKG
jgi:hypothetical protein